jgi:O-antigen/teichoic acid export membrane protein
MSKRRLFTNTLIYSVVSVLQKAVMFFMMPLITAYLTTADYGKVDIVTTMSTFLSVFFILALNGAGVRYTYKYLDDPEKVKRLWGSLFLVSTLNSVLMFAACWGLGGLLSAKVFPNISFQPYIFLGFLITVTVVPYNMHQAYLQCLQKGREFGTNNFLNFLMNIGLTVVFVVVLHWSAKGVLIARLVTNVAFLIYSLVAFVPLISLKIDRALIRESFRYAFPLIPHSVAGFAVPLIDRVFINSAQTTSSVGLFSVGFQLSNVLNTFIIAVNQAYSPWFFEQSEKGEQGRAQIRDVAVMLVTGFALLGFLGSLFSREVLHVLTARAFWDGWRVVPLLMIAYVVNGVYFVVVGGLFLRATWLVPVVTVSSACVSVVCDVFLVPRFGMIGAGLANIAASLVSSVVALLLAERTEGLGFPWKRMYGAIAVGAALSLVVYLQFARLPFPLLLLKIGLAVVVTLAFLLVFRARLVSLVRVLVRTPLARSVPRVE